MELDLVNADITPLYLDSLGIISSLSKELGIAERIDKKLYNNDKRRKVTPGKAVEAMLLNTLGFSERALYLTPHFYKGKPVSELLGDNIESKDLNAYTLGHTLDEISNYGCTKLFSEIVLDIAIEKNLLNNINNVDTTTFSLHGNYKNEQEENDNDTEDIKRVNITYGYSKDKRQDLKQVTLSMVMNSKINIPLWIESLDGNKSDKETLQNTIEKVNKFVSGLDMEKPFSWIADSALYNKKKLLKTNNFIWITRIPITLTESKEFITRKKESLEWEEIDSNYKYTKKGSNYGGIAQNWLMFHSEEKYKKDKSKFTENYEKEKVLIKKLNERYELKRFSTEAICKKQLKNINEYKYHNVKTSIEKINRKYKLKLKITLKKEEIESKKRSFGRFILGTNDIKESCYQTNKILDLYKSQQNIERGFKFLKDPHFMADSFYLKKEERISSLLMIMSLSLLIYNYGQYKLHKNQKNQSIKLPNQKGKSKEKISLKWALKLMKCISILVIKQGKETKKIMTQISPVQKQIIKILCLDKNVYGLKEQNTS